MKKYWLILCIVSSGYLSAQVKYDLVKNITYYPDSMGQNDPYIASQCKLDIYYPQNVKNFVTIVWFHGGGLTQGLKEIPVALTEKGIAVVGVEYRLSPKAKAPAYIEDAAASVAWVFHHIASYGGNPQAIFISGHSAGANLGLIITLD